jgi:hypothetical protein
VGCENIPHKYTKIKYPRGDKDATVFTSAGGHLATRPAAPKMQSGSLKPTAKGTVIPPVSVASMKASLNRTSLGAPGEVTGPMSGTPLGTPGAEVNKAVPPGERHNKTSSLE